MRVNFLVLILKKGLRASEGRGRGGGAGGGLAHCKRSLSLTGESQDVGGEGV